jgi:hypothetical protein
MSINDQIPEEFNHLILKCLEKDPKRRYQSADEVLDQIVRIERGFPTTDSLRPEKRTSKEIPGRRIPKFLVPGAVALAALILVMSLIIFKPWQGSSGVVDEGKSDDQNALIKKEDKKGEEEKLPVQKGSFEITSEPMGADVYLDDKLLGKTPLKQELSSGSHKLRLALPGHKMKTADIDIEAGKTFVETYVLEPSYVLLIKSVPTGARVKMDGKYVGTTGADALEVESPKVTCRLSFEKSGWQPLNVSLTLKPGENPVSRNLVRVKPKPKPDPDREEKKREEEVVQKVMFAINTSPGSARVFLNGKLVGTSPVKASYPPGKYQIKIEKAGYQTREFSVDLQTNFERTYNLEKLDSLQIVIKVHPWADVFIDGKFVGQIPPVKKVPIDVGKHTIKFKRDGQFIDRVIEIKRGQNLEVFMNLLTGEFRTKVLEPSK